MRSGESRPRRSRQICQEDFIEARDYPIDPKCNFCSARTAWPLYRNAQFTPALIPDRASIFQVIRFVTTDHKVGRKEPLWT
jgi:hypothetical protein